MAPRPGPTASPVLHAVVSHVRIVPDEVPAIQDVVCEWTLDPLLSATLSSDDAVTPPDLLFTTGGTGFAPRDVTPEAVTPLLHKHAGGLAMAMMHYSLQVTHMAPLARPVAGVRGKTVVLTLPGSPKAIKEILTPLMRILPHAVKLVKDESTSHSLGGTPHMHMHGGKPSSSGSGSSSGQSQSGTKEEEKKKEQMKNDLLPCC